MLLSPVWRDVVWLSLTTQITVVYNDILENVHAGSLSRVFTTWLILFVSKLIILQAISLAFGDSVIFSGALHGMAAFIIAAEPYCS